MFYAHLFNDDEDRGNPYTGTVLFRNASCLKRWLDNRLPPRFEDLELMPHSYPTVIIVSLAHLGVLMRIGDVPLRGGELIGRDTRIIEGQRCGGTECTEDSGGCPSVTSRGFSSYLNSPPFMNDEPPGMMPNWLRESDWDWGDMEMHAVYGTCATSTRDQPSAVPEHRTIHAPDITDRSKYNITNREREG